MQYDSVIIGAGQSGLYAAKALAERNKHYVVLERNQIGQQWQQRLNGMRLFTSRQFCALPGLHFPGDPQGFPLTTEVAEYLKLYAKTFSLNVKTNTQVLSVTREGSLYVIKTNNTDRIEAKTIINATGSNQLPQIPTISHQLSRAVIQLPADIPNLDAIKNGHRVAVIGDGASGRQIAAQLASRCEVSLACGQRRGMPPNKVFGKDIFWWLSKLGILSAGNGTIVSKILKKRNPVPLGEFTNPKLAKQGVTIFERLVSCNGDTLLFVDGRQAAIDVVIWATGYQDDTRWLKVEHCIDQQGFVQDNGLTPASGLFVVGRKWLSCRASELIMGVERDVDHVMTLVDNHLGNKHKVDV
ncbi:potassium uptake trka-like protein [Photobacterium sanctipauli]|uniref:Potassium uptake trka-like protein n=1 Tax=Photobacterium sanctipauli TaxID=1342794 RepID=A0A2T3P191_9GAMM|nr:NAD(P)/FAD-dependent oxidoreductase [Photobacterium sanctipauli]PSW22270.1 potassium uptake trka-like protein [Photobacterium sanctipauli]